MIISFQKTLRDALKKMSKEGKKSLIIGDEGNIFKGILSDGDIRKALLKGKNLKTKIKDIYNKKASFLYEDEYQEKIAKDTWTLVDNLSINGNAYEGSTVNFWDDIVDTAATNSDNSYFIINRADNGGVLRWPLDIVIDLNKQVKINRFKVWQRAFWYNAPNDPLEPYYYQAENLRTFDIYVSNDKLEWELVGSYDIGDPMNSEGIIPGDKLEEAALGHDFSLEEISPQFRYLKFSITANFGSDTFVHGSEISLYGIDNL